VFSPTKTRQRRVGQKTNDKQNLSLIPLLGKEREKEFALD